MIIELYYALIILSLFFLVYGFWTKTDLWRIVGVLLLFYAGSMLSPAFPNALGTVEVQVGHTDVTTNDTTVRTYDYEVFTNHTLAFWIVLVSILGFVIIMVTRRGQDD